MAIANCTRTAEAKAFIFGEAFIDRVTEMRAEIENSVQTFIFEEQITIVRLLVPWAMDLLLAINSGDLKLKNDPLDQWRLTGDVARQDEDGCIWLVDRKKDVIITGGENIYPVEIEDFLNNHPKIHDVAAIGLPSLRLGEFTTAIIKVRNGCDLTNAEVNGFCNTLARYKRPRKIIFGDVPRNPTGKIEKPKLGKQYAGQAESF